MRSQIAWGLLLLVSAIGTAGHTADARAGYDDADGPGKPSPQAATPEKSDGLWHTDFEAAKRKAKAESKLLLADFTGSDWCFWCKKLKREVLDQEAFKAAAPKRFVLVELDYPRRTKLPEKLSKQNAALRAQYKISGYPTVLLLSADGQFVAKTGYRPDGPEEFLRHLTELLGIHQEVLALKKQLDGAEGADRAPLLNKLIESSGKLGDEGDEATAWSKEIAALDAAHKARLATLRSLLVLTPLVALACGWLAVAILKIRRHGRTRQLKE
jgi:thioredoxin-related protein